jgi:hypothetical protein
MVRVCDIHDGTAAENQQGEAASRLLRPFGSLPKALACHKGGLPRSWQTFQRRFSTLDSGDILFARTGATTGKSFLIRNCPLSVFASYLIRLRPLIDAVDPFRSRSIASDLLSI